jgi:hypothetical protein
MILFLLSLTLLLAACNRDGPIIENTVLDVPAIDGNQIEPIAVEEAANHETLVDEQGAVSVAVTPLNLEETDAETLAFEVVMNTHSVDLSMDLASLTTLKLDNGNEVTAVLWDAQPGGHHVSGILSFPASVNGTTLLAEASQLTLTIRDVDVSVRVFTWQLGK